MKRALLVCFLIFFALFTAAPSLRAETALKIGVFDFQRILRESKVIEAMRQKLGKELGSKQKVFTEKQNVVRQLEEKLNKEGPQLTARERKNAEERLADEARELKRLKEDLDIEIQKMDRNMTQKIMSELTVVVKKIAGSENYDMVFEKNSSGIVYFTKTVDLTDKIVNMYDTNISR